MGDGEHEDDAEADDGATPTAGDDETRTMSTHLMA